jgi:hypothetical protein
MDVYERVQEEDAKQASIIMATFVYHAAMRDESFLANPLMAKLSQHRRSNLHLMQQRLRRQFQQSLYRHCLSLPRKHNLLVNSFTTFKKQER